MIQGQKDTQKKHKKLIVMGGVNAYDQPERKISVFFTSRLITQENVAARRKSNDNISQSRKEKTPELNKEKTSPPSKENTPQFKKERTPQPRKEKNPSPSKEKIPDCKTTPTKEKTLPSKGKTPNKEAAPQFKQDNALGKDNASQNIDGENKNNASQPKMSDEGKAETKEVTPQSTEVKLMTGSKKSGPMDHLPEVSAISASLSCNLPPTRP